MSAIRYDPQKPFTLRFVPHSPHTFAYRVCYDTGAGDSSRELEHGDLLTSPKPHDPLPRGTTLDYDLLIGGNPLTDWLADVTVIQQGNVLACSRAIHGTTNESGVDERKAVIALE